MHLSLAVNATQQRSIGRALVAWLEQSALTAGITEIQLELRTTIPARDFFTRRLASSLCA
jgi:hypothetical protein